MCVLALVRHTTLVSRKQVGSGSTSASTTVIKLLEADPENLYVKYTPQCKEDFYLKLPSNLSSSLSLRKGFPRSREQDSDKKKRTDGWIAGRERQSGLPGGGSILD